MEVPEKATSTPQEDAVSIPQMQKKHPFQKQLLILAVVALIISAGIYALHAYTSKKETNTSISIVPSRDISPEGTHDITRYKNIINDGEIYYIGKDGATLFVLNTTTMESVEYDVSDFVRYSDLSISPDGEYLFVNGYIGDGYIQGDILIHRLRDQQTKKISMSSDTIGPSPRINGKHIAPNSQFFILTTSCCPGDVGLAVYDIDGTFITQRTGRALVWAPDENMFAISKGVFELTILPVGPAPKNSSIYLETIHDNLVREKLLVPATPQTSFEPVEWLNESILVYRKEEYSEPFPADPTNEELNNRQLQDKWMRVYENPTVSYWKIDVATGVREEVVDFVLPDKLSNYSPSGKWHIVTKIENTSQWQTYVVNDDGTVQIELDAKEAVWR